MNVRNQTLTFYKVLISNVQTRSNHNKSIVIFYNILTFYLLSANGFLIIFAWSHSVMYVQNRAIAFSDDVILKCMYEIDPCHSFKNNVLKHTFFSHYWQRITLPLAVLMVTN